MVQVAAAHAVDDGHRLGSRLAVAQHDLAAGRARRVAQPFELQARVDVGQATVAVLRNLRAVERLPAGGNDDVADRHLDQFVFLVEPDSVGRAQFLAGPAALAFKPDAGFRIQHRHARHGLGKRHVNGLAGAHAGFEFGVHHLAGTFLHADAATGAQVVVDLARFLANLHLETAHRTRHFLQFGIGEQPDVLVLPHLGHLRASKCRPSNPAWETSCRTAPCGRRSTADVPPARPCGRRRPVRAWPADRRYRRPRPASSG